MCVSIINEPRVAKRGPDSDPFTREISEEFCKGALRRNANFFPFPFYIPFLFNASLRSSRRSPASLAGAVPTVTEFTRIHAHCLRRFRRSLRGGSAFTGSPSLSLCSLGSRLPAPPPLENPKLLLLSAFTHRLHCKHATDPLFSGVRLFVSRLASTAKIKQNLSLSRPAGGALSPCANQMLGIQHT